ncbi:hypothetical protein, partial [Acinetobacter baumannii]
VVRPKVVFAQSGAAFARAFDTLRALDPGLIFVTVDGAGEGAIPYAEAAGAEPTAAVEAARETLDHATVA